MIEHVNKELDREYIRSPSVHNSMVLTMTKDVNKSLRKE